MLKIFLVIPHKFYKNFPLKPFGLPLNKMKNLQTYWRREVFSLTWKEKENRNFRLMKMIYNFIIKRFINSSSVRKGIIQWRLNNGLSKQWTEKGPLTDFPDWSFSEVKRAVPIGKGQYRRRLEQENLRMTKLKLEEQFNSKSTEPSFDAEQETPLSPNENVEKADKNETTSKSQSIVTPSKKKCSIDYGSNERNKSRHLSIVNDDGRQMSLEYEINNEAKTDVVRKMLNGKDFRFFPPTFTSEYLLMSASKLQINCYIIGNLMKEEFLRDHLQDVLHRFGFHGEILDLSSRLENTVLNNLLCRESAIKRIRYSMAFHPTLFFIIANNEYEGLPIMPLEKGKVKGLDDFYYDQTGHLRSSVEWCRFKTKVEELPLQTEYTSFVGDVLRTIITERTDYAHTVLSDLHTLIWFRNDTNDLLPEGENKKMQYNLNEQSNLHWEETITLLEENVLEENYIEYESLGTSGFRAFKQTKDDIHQLKQRRGSVGMSNHPNYSISKDKFSFSRQNTMSIGNMNDFSSNLSSLLSSLIKEMTKKWKNLQSSSVRTKQMPTLLLQELYAQYQFHSIDLERISEFYNFHQFPSSVIDEFDLFAQTTSFPNVLSVATKLVMGKREMTEFENFTQLNRIDLYQQILLILIYHLLRKSNKYFLLFRLFSVTDISSTFHTLLFTLVWQLSYLVDENDPSDISDLLYKSQLDIEQLSISFVQFATQLHEKTNENILILINLTSDSNDAFNTFSNVIKSSKFIRVIYTNLKFPSSSSANKSLIDQYALIESEMKISPTTYRSLESIDKWLKRSNECAFDMRQIEPKSSLPILMNLDLITQLKRIYLSSYFYRRQYYTDLENDEMSRGDHSEQTENFLLKSTQEEFVYPNSSSIAYEFKRTEENCLVNDRKDQLSKFRLFPEFTMTMSNVKNNRRNIEHTILPIHTTRCVAMQLCDSVKFENRKNLFAHLQPSTYYALLFNEKLLIYNSDNFEKIYEISFEIESKFFHPVIVDDDIGNGLSCTILSRQGFVSIIYEDGTERIRPWLQFCPNSSVESFRLIGFTQLVCISRNRMNVQIIDVEDGRIIATLKTGEDRFLKTLHLFQHWALCLEDCKDPARLLLWNLQTHCLCKDIRIPQVEDPLSHVAQVSPNGKFFAIASYRTVQMVRYFGFLIFDLENNRFQDRRVTFEVTERFDPIALKWNDKSDYFFGSFNDGTIVMVNYLGTYLSILRCRGLSSPFMHLNVIPSDDKLIVIAYNREKKYELFTPVCVWEVNRINPHLSHDRETEENFVENVIMYEQVYGVLVSDVHYRNDQVVIFNYNQMSKEARLSHTNFLE
ncbi:hypothetical protein SNEBB_007084 [Seison nebaliae]|nr:hypothetical protein SNEBB_007084 [Seison nebaliae]